MGDYMIVNNISIFNDIMDKYELSNNDKKILLSMVSSFLKDNHFILRMTNKYLHHGVTTLGEHLLEDIVLSYKISKKYENNKKYPDFDINTVVKIAKMHDLYKMPWQNNPDASNKKFYNKHGFRHPIEAVINAIKWFPEEFSDDYEAYKIIDGIIHHMYPLPVSRLITTKKNHLQLNNYEALVNLPEKYQRMIIQSSNRNKIGPFSFAKSKFVEGRIMSHADKKVSINQFESIISFIALLTGKNKKIYNDSECKDLVYESNTKK